MKRIMLIKDNVNSYSQHLGQEQEIDNLYMKSLRMKIASAQLV